MNALIVGAAPALRDPLQDRGMHVTVAGTVAEATAAIGMHTFLVAILDLVQPDGSGLDVVDALRRSGSTAHLIVVGAPGSESDRADALQRGADDYVVKPFSLRELTERVLAVRRRQDVQRDTRINLGRCEVDLGARQVSCEGLVVELTTKEFDLLAYLAVRPGHVFDREQLLNAVWQSSSEWQQPATVTEHVRRLRHKIEADPGAPTVLVTIRGAGYRLDLPTVTGDPSDTITPPPPMGVVVHVEGRIVLADDAAGALVGVRDPATLVGRDLLDLVAPTSQAAATERQATIEAGRSRRSEIMHLRRADDERVLVAVASAPADWHGERARRVEVTALTDAPDRLREQFTGVLANVTDAVIITDLHSHILSWNTAAERIYGWSEAAVLGRHLLDILQWVGDEGQLAETWEQLERTDHWNGTIPQVTRDGSTVGILGSKTLLRDHDGEPIGIVSVDRPVEVAGAIRMLEMDAALAARVEQGIADDEFVVHYQPIIDLTDGHILSIEALVRWEHPERGTLFPAEFLDEAERTGLIVQLGELVLDKACRQAASWRRSGADVGLSVNVSARQLADPGLAERFAEIIRGSGFDPRHLWLEITETALVKELDTATHALRDLVELGVGVSIDDFGTGWASLTYLQSFPIHSLKIDRSFVAGMARSGNATVIVRSILSLAAELDLLVVAEGIESKKQHLLLESMGCRAGQGYYFARPTPACEMPIELARRTAEVVAGATPAQERLLRGTASQEQRDSEARTSRGRSSS